MPVVGAATLSVLPPLPVTAPVIVPLTPPTLAVIVTLDTGPIPFTKPVAPTVTQEVELCQLAELVTSFVPLSKVAVAFSWSVAFTATENVLLPEASITVTEFG